MSNTNESDKQSTQNKDEVAAIVAKICGCSPNYVYKVLRGERDTKSKRAKRIIVVYETYRNQKNVIIDSIKKLIDI